MGSQLTEKYVTLFILCHQKTALTQWYFGLMLVALQESCALLLFSIYYTILNRISYNEIQFVGTCLSVRRRKIYNLEPAVIASVR